MSKQANAARLTAKIIANLEKPRPVRTEAEVFAGLSDEAEPPMITKEMVPAMVNFILAQPAPESCGECGRTQGIFTEGPVLRCLRCQKALCFLCTGAHLDCRNRCEEAK